MQPSQTAEILRSPLELTVLNLKQLGESHCTHDSYTFHAKSLSNADTAHITPEIACMASNGQLAFVLMATVWKDVDRNC